MTPLSLNMLLKMVHKTVFKYFWQVCHFLVVNVVLKQEKYIDMSILLLPNTQDPLALI